MKLRIEFEIDNDDFYDFDISGNPAIVTSILDNIDWNNLPATIRDLNGNTIGTAELIDNAE